MKSCDACSSTYPSDFRLCPYDGTTLVELRTWLPGSVIRGRYRILHQAGQGGMATVYKAVDVTCDEERAIKVIRPRLLGDQSQVRRFRSEGIYTRKLHHPNVVRVQDIDEAEDGRPFIVMEYIEGQNLRQVMQNSGYLSVSRVCSIVKQVGSALDIAHRLGIVHRDIKPTNIVLRPPEGEQVKVLDFGIAKLKEARNVETTADLTGTSPGMVIGTPEYMSPEQAIGKRGDELDGRSDLYSLGVVMYEMLTGDLPFKADTVIQMLIAHLHSSPRPMRHARPGLEIPDTITNLVMACLEKRPESRPPSAETVIKEIERAEAEMVGTAHDPPLRANSSVLVGLRQEGPNKLSREGEAVDLSRGAGNISTRQTESHN
jgi:serine/threonine-protein kinase